MTDLSLAMANAIIASSLAKAAELKEQIAAMQRKIDSMG